jgi:hypothetical protein
MSAERPSYEETRIPPQGGGWRGETTTWSEETFTIVLVAVAGGD